MPLEGREEVKRTNAMKMAIPRLELEAEGKHDEAQESVQFLLKQSPDDPQEHVRLSLLKGQQGDRAGAIDAEMKAIQLFEARSDLNGAALAHLALADLLKVEVGANPNDQRAHLEAAVKLYKQLGIHEGEVNAQAALGAYFASKKEEAKAHQYFEGALKIAREAKRKDLEAGVLSQIGQAYQSSGDWTKAVEYYGKSSDIYQQLNDPANEAFQLRNMAVGFDAMHRPEEALKTALRAEAVADTSDSWAARYWVRRSLAGIYEAQGQYQIILKVLQEAKQISDTANQPQNSAWAALSLAAVLEIIGSWQEALEQVNSALPVLKQFKDSDDEAVTSTEI